MMTNADCRLIAIAQDLMLAARPLKKLKVTFAPDKLGKDGHHMVNINVPQCELTVERTDYLKYFNSIHPIN